MQFYSAIRSVVYKLHRELPSSLTYHDYDHVRDVYRMAREIGRAEGLDEYELKLVLTAAILHDSGFIIGNEDHERKSCAIAREILPHFGYTEEEIAVIEALIMCTSIPHKPENLAQQVLCDADLDYLGRTDFYKRAEQLFVELQNLGLVKDRRTWNMIQVKFLNQHKFFTRTSIDARNGRKAEHLATIVKELAAEKND